MVLQAIVGALALVAALLFLALFYLRRARISKRVLGLERSTSKPARFRALTFLDSIVKKNFAYAPFYQGLGCQLVTANSKAGPDRFIVDSALWAIGFGVLGLWAQGIWGFLIALVVTLGVRLYQPRVTVARRQAKFQEQFDYTVNLFSASVKAGHSLIRAIEIVAIQSEAPTNQEFSYALNAVRLGKDMGDAMLEVAKRMNSQELEWVAQSINIHRESGGNLTEMFDTVISTIKDRNSIRVMIRTLSTDGRVSGQVMSVMPLGILILFGAQRPESFSVFVETQLGNALLAMAITLYVAGVLWIRKIVKVRF